MKKIKEGKIKISLEIRDGDHIVLLDMLNASKSITIEEIQRNVYRIDVNGKVIWQISPYDAFSNSTFTNVYISDDKLLGYNFDGGEYEINLETGKVKPKQLLK